MEKQKLHITVGCALLALNSGAIAGGGANGDSDGSHHLYGSEFETVSTSSDFERQTLELRHGSVTAGDSGLGVAAKYHRINDAGLSYRAVELKTHAGAPVGQVFHLDSGIGTSKIEGRHDDLSEDLVTYQLGARAHFNAESSIGINHDKDFAYQDQILTNAAGKILTAETTTADIRLRPAERIRLEGKSEYRELSDGNHSRHYKVGAYYGISPGWPWIWAGIEADKIDYRFQDDAYWTPENHRSIAATFSSSAAISKHVNLNTSASVNRSKQDGSDDTSTGYYVSVGSDIELSPNSQLSADIHYIKSAQDDTDWNEKGASLGFEFNHF